ncbi:hypothetical protein PIB30_066359 [Stylosanthes scabra]|uniref:Uncharacterized protein n=1 Tax=Stylosanthes scabra TaxID=79078 RepID=A0ABU6XK63_9FABA|nr:hypothetical protein [Stylosanthes scabra]
MKTPPNFEDEANVVEDNTTLFKEGVKFGEVRLEVGMRFKSKKDFMDAVRDKEHRDKGIIALLEEVRLFAMRSFAKNKLKLANHLGKLPPIQHSHLQKIKSQAHLYGVHWAGDDPFERNREETLLVIIKLNIFVEH